MILIRSKNRSHALKAGIFESASTGYLHLNELMASSLGSFLIYCHVMYSQGICSLADVPIE